MEIRRPAVAGKFYPSKKKDIQKVLSSIYEEEKNKINLKLSRKNIIGGIVPHAGYVYSGYEATHFFNIIKNSKKRYDSVVILNPNHTGYGKPVSFDENEYWETPYGQVPLDIEMMNAIGFDRSVEAHRYEHSGEVILPFLQHYLEYDFKIIPVCILSQTFDQAGSTAESIYQYSQTTKKNILIIASSDFSHFVSPETGRKLDDLAIKEILNFRSKELYNVIREHNISICGYGPIMTLLEYAKLVCEKPEIELLSRGNSGKSYPSDEVVDYASFLVYHS